MKIIPQNSKQSHITSKDSLNQVMADVLSRARALGATDASVSANYDRGFSVDVRMGEVETVAFSEDQGISVNVYLGQKTGCASSSDISAQALDAMVLAAYEIARVSASDPCFGLPDPALVSSQYMNLDLSYPWDLTPEQAIKNALECEHYALNLDPRIKKTEGVSLSTYSSCQGYASTQGFVGLVDSTLHGLNCSVLAQDDRGMQRDGEYTTARNYIDLLPAEVLAARAVARTAARLGARRLKTQKVPVLFSSELSSGLFSSFIAAISGGNLYRKNTFLLDSIGQIIFPENINIHEQPHLLGALGSSPFDREGVLTRNNRLIDSGRLCQYVLSSYSARKLGLATTANSGGVFNLTVDPTAGDVKELLSTMGTGLYVTELMGHGINLLNGDYSRGACGFWVSGGEIQYAVEEITIAGNLKDMFARIVAVGNDRNLNSSTRCGSVLVEQMMIAGTS